MTDGVRIVEITMTGGTGGAHISFPVQLAISVGSMTAMVE